MRRSSPRRPPRASLPRWSCALAGGYTHVLAPATGFGKNVMPRVAALLDVAQISEIIAVEIARHVRAPDLRRQRVRDGAVEGRDQGDHRARDRVRRGARDRRHRDGRERRRRRRDPGLAKVVGQELTKSIGRSSRARASSSPAAAGSQSGENFKMLEALADKLNAAIGASRAAVDAGYVPNDYQVGQTGKIVAPDLYIAIGISGAIQHLAGMKDSKVIVAINKDPDAPIFQIADYGLVGDLFEIIPQLTAELG